MRKISPEEIFPVSAAISEMFSEYDAYKLFFDDLALEKGRELFFVCEIFCAQNFTYTDDGYAVIASVKCPGNKEKPLAELLNDRDFYDRLHSVADRRALDLAKEYMCFADSLSEKYYNPSTDCYIKNIGVAKSARGKGLLKKAISELCGNLPVYLETHTEQNVEVYKRLGFALAEKTEFYGVPVYAMKRH